MKITRTLPFVAMLLCCFSFSASAGDAPPAPEWDAVLDGIYAHTWRGRADLAAELKSDEARIGQDLPAYIAAWERHMALPIVYTDNSRGVSGCEPLAYCQADLADTRKFILKLQERKVPLTRFLFDKLSPAAQKTIAEYNPAASPSDKVSAAPASQLLAGELTRIVRADTLYDAERFTGVPLSYTAMTLVNQHNDAQNRVCINKTLLADAFPEEIARNFKCVIMKDEAYRRVVAAKTVQYLRTGDKKALDEGIALSEKFEDKLMYTDFAFWYHYPRTLADIHVRDSAALTFDAYSLLNDVVLAVEPAEPDKATAEELERRHYGWNLADVVLVKGIMESKMEGLEALGSAMWLLGYHIDKKAGSDRERELAQRIVDVRKFLLGPESDNFRLNYAVAMSEGKRQSALLTQALNAKGKGAPVEQLFTAARENLRLAGEWAGTGQGTTVAATNYLELVNLALARMKDLLPPSGYATLAATPGKANAGTAVALYRELAKRERGGWERQRFIDHKGYVDSAQRLWNALQRNSLLVGGYYLQRMDTDDFQSVMDNAEPAERALLRYVALFEATTENGHREIMPDSAYFAYAEALKMLSRLKRVVSAYNNRIESHNQAITYLLKAIEAYPYDDSINEYASISRNINTDFNYQTTDNIISRILSNNVIAKCLDATNSYCDKSIKQTLEWNIYKTKSKLYGKINVDRLAEMKLQINHWKDEKRATGITAGNYTKKISKGNHDKNLNGVPAAAGNVSLAVQRGTVVKLADRYLAASEKIAAQTADARQQLAKCSADGVACADGRDPADTLPTKKEEFQQIRNELLSAADSYRQMLAITPGDGKELEYLTKLSGIVNDVYLNQTDRLIEVGMQRMLNTLRHKDEHPMHKIIKSAYYMYQ